jgi:hypothetical protein
MAELVATGTSADEALAMMQRCGIRSDLVSQIVPLSIMLR